MGLCYRFQENHVISGVVDPIYQVFSVDLSGFWKHLSTFGGDSAILILIVKIYNEKMPNDSDGLIVPKRCIVHHHSLKSNPDIVWRCMKSVKNGNSHLFYFFGGKHVVNASMQDAGRDRIYIPLPEEAARHRMLEHFLKEGPDGVMVTWLV